MAVATKPVNAALKAVEVIVRTFAISKVKSIIRRINRRNHLSIGSPCKLI
jgi:hypothetical protein